MTLKRPETQPTEEDLPDALVAIAATLQDAPTAEEVLNRLTRGLSARGVACALFVQAGEGPDFLVERSTLPLTPDVWGRPLRLSRLAAILKRGRPSLESDVAASLSEASRDGKSRLLLSDSVEGPLAAVPLRPHSERGAILCLTASELSRQDMAPAWAWTHSKDSRIIPTRPSARAVLVVTGFSLTSTIRALPASSTCDNFIRFPPTGLPARQSGAADSHSPGPIPGWP